MKTLVVYYSFEGNTERAAKEIANKISADVLELVPVKDNPSDGAGKYMIGGMKATFGIKTKLKDFSTDVNMYDHIILGTPIWAGKSVPAVNTFIRKYKFLDKVVGIFTCSGGGDNEKCIIGLKKKLPNVKYTVALADCRNEKLAALNNEKLNQFIEECKKDNTSI